MTAFAGSFAWFAACRFFTGAGIGGEYAAINSAIDELIPARVRGTVDLIINGSFWLGTLAGASLTLLLLDKGLFNSDLGWRLAFGLGAVLGLGILLVRRNLPESPRWLFIHGRLEEAEKLVDGIEREVKESTGQELPEPEEAIRIRPRKVIGIGTIARTLIRDYRERTVVGLALFIGQAFLYNAVFFTYALILTRFLDVSSSTVPVYLIPFAIGNFLGPLLLGRLFDTIGRKPMITGTYVISGALLIVTGLLFKNDSVSATELTILWSVVFFFASAGASSAYLTVSEIFPMETRAMSIAVFYAVGTGIGGVTGPLLFGRLVENGDRNDIFLGWSLAAALMIIGGITEAIFGVEAAQRRLEDVAQPLTAEEEEERGREEERPRPAAPRRQRARFGPSEFGTGWSPRGSSSTYVANEAAASHEVDILANALADRGPTGRDELRRLVGARYWGPGRFRRALDRGVSEGRVRRAGRGRYDSGKKNLERSG
jgi:MFS family permease